MNEALEFEQKLLELKAVFGLSDSQIDNLKRAAIDVAHYSDHTAEEAATLLAQSYALELRDPDFFDAHRREVIEPMERRLFFGNTDARPLSSLLDDPDVEEIYSLNMSGENIVDPDARLDPLDVCRVLDVDPRLVGFDQGDRPPPAPRKPARPTYLEGNTPAKLRPWLENVRNAARRLLGR